MKQKISLLSILIIGITLLSYLTVNAQNQIDITSDHASLGSEFARSVWSTFQGSVLSLPQKKTMPSGKKGHYIKLTFEDRIRKASFRNAVNRVVNNNSDMVNTVGGWTDENGEIITLILLNASDTKERAMCLVFYNEDTGVALFNTMSSNL